jgi:hypothetical protein
LETVLAGFHSASRKASSNKATNFTEPKQVGN